MKRNWDKNHYNKIYDFMMHQLEHRPWCSTIDCPFECAKSKTKLVKFCQDKEDYEGAQATKDAIMDFLNQFIKNDDDKIKIENTIKFETT